MNQKQENTSVQKRLERENYMTIDELVPSPYVMENLDPELYTVAQTVIFEFLSQNGYTFESKTFARPYAFFGFCLLTLTYSLSSASEQSALPCKLQLRIQCSG